LCILCSFFPVLCSVCHLTFIIWANLTSELGKNCIIKQNNEEKGEGKRREQRGRGEIKRGGAEERK
jgi:hypothetical protein